MVDGPASYASIGCSFCNRRQEQVRRLVGSHDLGYICNECILLFQQIIDEEDSPIHPDSQSDIGELSPRTINQKLDEYVVGQDLTKRILSVAVYNHYKRIKAANSNTNTDIELQKTNVLMVGPTGSGKTLLAQTLARILNVPFCIVDATAVTEAGYVGEDVENILLRLIHAASYDVKMAERGIIYIDEIDKIGRKSANPSITRDVSGEGVQQALLKIIEGCTANVPPQGGRKHPHQELLQIKTDDILFICGGAFEGLDQIVANRIAKSNQNIGFRTRFDQDINVKDKSVLRHMNPEDLLSYGFIPELIGRLPVTVSLEPLDKEALVNVLTKPKNAVTKQYQSLFSMDGVDLIFEDEAIGAAAELAMLRNTGARGLRSVIEQTLLDIMYELPSMENVYRCTVTSDAIYGKASPLLTNKAGQVLDFVSHSKKTA